MKGAQELSHALKDRASLRLPRQEADIESLQVMLEFEVMGKIINDQTISSENCHCALYVEGGCLESRGCNSDTGLDLWLDLQIHLRIHYS